MEVKRAYRDSGSTLQTTSAVATITYDGLGRRIKKFLAKNTNSGDWDATYHYYYDGQRTWHGVADRSSRVVEMRDGSWDVLKQYVWGQTYVDELVQIGINDDPADAGEDLCETHLYALQDANFNVLGLIESDGDLKERYEYTPYGQRSVYKFCGTDDDLCSAPLHESQRVQISSVAQAYGLWDVGHQGLLHDKEFGLIYTGARSLHPRLGRFLQRDPLGYDDGMNLYQYLRGNPVTLLDAAGLLSKMELVQYWIEINRSVDTKTKFMLKQLKQKNVKMYVKNSWLWDYDGEEDYIWIDCDYNGLTEATAWYEDGMREWAKNNKDGTYRQIVRDYALGVKSNGGDAVKVLADTYNFAHMWTKYASGDASWDMMGYEGLANATMWAFADRGLSPAKTSAAVNVTDQGIMSKFYYNFASGQAQPHMDQTHHFAGYFALGATVRAPRVIGGGWAYVTRDTPVNNPGDYLLAVVAVNLGQSYRSDPRYIGREITVALRKDPTKRDPIPANINWNAAIHYATIYLASSPEASK